MKKTINPLPILLLFLFCLSICSCAKGFGCYFTSGDPQSLPASGVTEDTNERDLVKMYPNDSFVSATETYCK
ncbi:MAG: hypothetical protein ACI8VT_001086 [Saprospiraceae bacterium]|jgi:hypothetical protein